MGNQGENRIKDRDFFVRSDAAKHGKAAAEELAVALLGKVLCRRIYEDGKPFVLKGRIVMTEAYLAGESVTDATKAPTAQLKIGGCLYIANTHGWCRCDIVAGEEGSGESVLIRSLDPYGSHPSLSACSLSLDDKNGEGRYLFDGADLIENEDIWLEEEDGAEVLDIVKGKRERLPEGATQESIDAELKFSVREIRYKV